MELKQIVFSPTGGTKKVKACSERKGNELFILFSQRSSIQEVLPL